MRFRYKAKTEAGRKVSGVLDAADESEVYSKLKGHQLYMLSCKPEKDRRTARKMKARALADLCWQLGTLLASGVTLVRSLNIIVEDENTSRLHKEIFEQVLTEVKRGITLSDAMEAQGQAFPPLLVNMIRSAEASGELDRICMRMSEHYEKEFRLNAKIKGVTAYPRILAVLTIAAVLILFTFVIPQFEQLFEQLEELPLITRMVMAVSDGIRIHWLTMILTMVFAVVLLGVIMRIPAVRFQKDWIKVRLPIFGKRLKQLYTARFSRTLSSLYGAGLPMIACLQIARNTIGNIYIEDQFDEVIDKVRNGEKMSAAFMAVDGFTKKLTSAIIVGEETGSLDSMLDSISDSLSYEAEMAVSRMITLIEPAMIVLMAIIVGIVILAVMLPLYGSYDMIGNLGMG